MLRRLLIIVLTLAVPAQGLAVPHAHGTVGGGELEPHAQTPHFHLGRSHHHGHHHAGEHQHPHHEPSTPEHAHDDPGKPSEQLDDPVGSGSHDGDASYVSGGSCLNLAKVARQVIRSVDLVFYAVSEPPSKLRPNPKRSVASRPPVFLGVPLFLSALSLRL